MFLYATGENSTEIAGRLKRDVLPTLLNGLMFWPLCDFFTYKVLPVHLQVYNIFITSPFLEFCQ